MNPTERDADGVDGAPGEIPMVLYCLIRRPDPAGGPCRLLLSPRYGSPTFPPTKFRKGEDLFAALVRPMEEDLGIPRGSYFVEEELPMIPSSGESPRYPGLPKSWFLYPVVISLTPEAQAAIEAPGGDRVWWTPDEVAGKVTEPNVAAIVRYMQVMNPAWLRAASVAPGMDAIACQWAAEHDAGVRAVRAADVRRILGAGDRAFNLRVADPYLAYQRQGFGFTWSFFTPRDKQDLHVHGLPAVEIYGVIEGRLQLWHKPMNQRGVRTWQAETLGPGDWAEVEPLHCHFAAWLDPEGLGTVIKAAGSGELAGVGRLGVSGKTVCTWKGPDGRELHCNNHGHCAIPPAMQVMIEEYGRPLAARNYERIRAAAVAG